MREAAKKFEFERAAALRGVRFAGLRFTPDFDFFTAAMTAAIFADSRRYCKVITGLYVKPALRLCRVWREIAGVGAT